MLEALVRSRGARRWCQSAWQDAHWCNRLREGLEQNIGPVIAKAVLGLIGEGLDYRALVRDAVLYGGFMFQVLLTVVALCAVSALADTPDTIDDTGVPKLPVFGPTMLRFKACSAGGRELDVQVKVINFSAGDLILPDGYVWATKEENAAAALEVMKSVYGRHLSYMPDAIVEKDALLSEIALGRDIVRGTDDKGNPEERRVSTGLRILLETKMALMAKGKYSGMSVNFEPQNTFVKLTDKECDPLLFRE